MVRFMRIPDADAGKFRVVPLPSAVPPERWPSLSWTVLPTISAPNDDTGTTITVSTGTLSGSGTRHWMWQDDGVDIPGTLDAATYVSSVAQNGHRIRARVWVENWALEVFTESILLDDPAESWPAAMPAGYLMVDEIRDPADPDAANNGYQRLKLNESASVPVGYEALAYLGGAADGNPAAATAIAAGGTKLRKFTYAVGDKFTAVVYLKRTADGQVRSWLPSSGNTVTPDWDVGVTPAPAGRAIAALDGDAGRGKVVVTVVGLTTGSGGSFTWPALSSAARTQAMAAPLGGYRVTGGAGAESNLQDRLHGGPVGCAYNSFAGDSTTDARVKLWVAEFDGSGDMPFCASAPSAAREAIFPAMWALIRLTPRLYTEVATKVTDSQKSRADTMIKALLIANAVRMSDANTSRLTITGYDNPTGISGLPNLGTSPLLVMAACVGYMGLAEAVDFLENVDVATFRAALISQLGSGSNMGITWNWGETSQNASTYYRAGPHGNALTDAQIQTYIRGWTLNGFGLSNLPRALLPYLTAGDAPGLNRVIPPAMWTKGSNTWNGLVWDRPRSTRSYFDTWSDYVVIGGTEAGLFSAHRAGMTHKGDTDCSIGELNGTDEGTRWATPYGLWTYAAAFSALLALAVREAIDPDNATFGPWLHRWKKAQDVLFYLMTHSHYPLAHMDPTTPPSGQNGGAGRPWGTDFTTYADEYSPLALMDLAHAVNRKWRIEHVKNASFDEGAKRWKNVGAASIAAASGVATVTITGSGGGIGNRTEDWSGAEPADHNSTGHIEVVAGTTYELVVTARRGTYPAAGIVLSLAGSEVTTAALTASFVTYRRDWTAGASGRLTLVVKGSSTNTGTVEIDEISLKPR